MNIAIFHPQRLPVWKYGGTERVVVWLADALSRLGHEVTVYCARGSKIRHTTVELDPTEANAHDFDLGARLDPNHDIVHYFVPIHRTPGLPHLWTMQGNARRGFEPGRRCVFVSADHARRHGGKTFVYNGIDLAEYEPRSSPDGPFLFLGRLQSVKGWKEAIRVSRAVGRAIDVAGGWRPSLSKRVRFHGRVGGEAKRELLARSAAVLAPIRWAEPFGIVVAEALASGSPVIGRPCGSFPELVTADVGGLADSRQGLIKLARRPDRWDPDECRRRAEREFSHLTMGERYLEVYRRVIETGSVI